MWYSLDKYLQIRKISLKESEEFLTKSDRKIAYTKISSKIAVSTVFLGLDHSFGNGELLLFETLVFNGKYDGTMLRYSSYESAVKGHNELVAITLKTHRKKAPLEHYIRKKVTRPLEFCKEDTKTIIRRIVKKVIKNDTFHR